MNAPFPIDPHQTAIAIAYRNKKLIADSVLPRLPVSKKEFKYLEHTLAESFTIPDTKVGRKSAPNEVSFTAKEKTDSTEDFGLDDKIPFDDIEQATENFDPLGHSTESLTNLILLDREVRTAGLVFAAASYASDNKKTLLSNWYITGYGEQSTGSFGVSESLTKAIDLALRDTGVNLAIKIEDDFDKLVKLITTDL